MTSHTLAPAAFAPLGVLLCSGTKGHYSHHTTQNLPIKLSTLEGDSLRLVAGGTFTKDSGQRSPAVSHEICRKGFTEHLKSSWKPKPEQACHRWLIRCQIQGFRSQFTHFRVLGDISADILIKQALNVCVVYKLAWKRWLGNSFQTRTEQVFILEPKLHVVSLA